jgi:pyruvate/2-oxoglutarate dehydrogenase complex dihydrolipoamide dehydrogenase (E3) component
MDAFDLIGIGTGTAAQVAAGRLRKAGRSVAVIDHRPFGGTCALRGCDPKKMPEDLKSTMFAYPTGASDIGYML